MINALAYFAGTSTRQQKVLVFTDENLTPFNKARLPGKKYCQ
jgi:hypothetical protein